MINPKSIDKNKIEKTLVNSPVSENNYAFKFNTCFKKREGVKSKVKTLSTKTETYQN